MHAHMGRRWGAGWGKVGRRAVPVHIAVTAAEGRVQEVVLEPEAVHQGNCIGADVPQQPRLGLPNPQGLHTPAPPLAPCMPSHTPNQHHFTTIPKPRRTLNLILTHVIIVEVPCGFSMPSDRSWQCISASMCDFCRILADEISDSKIQSISTSQIFCSFAERHCLQPFGHCS